jgi:hypothetical protein
MNKSSWKSAEELRFSLKDAQKVSIFTCGVCANLSGTGGSKGLRFIEGILRDWGKEVLLSKCITACCAQEIMRQAVRIYRKPISESDALVVVSCAAGVKSACLCCPDTRVVAAADSVGSVPVSQQDDPVARSQCTNCGHCVISFTGGICPLSECPAGRKYEPCSKFPATGSACAVDPSRDCVWKEIEKRGDLDALKELALIHTANGDERMSSPPIMVSPMPLKRFSGWVVAKAGWFEKLVPFVN